LSLSGLLFKGGDNVSPTFLIFIKFYLKSERPKSNLLPEQRGILPLADAASLDCYEGTQSTDTNETLGRDDDANVMKVR
jgi:hypothetical protein